VLPPALLDAARRSYTEGAWNEYRTAAAFAELSRALLQARAPVDLVALAADFVVDEMGHVELNARMAMELGGAAPLFVSFDELIGELVAASPLERAAEIAVRVSCVGEALSAPLLATAARSATHPLTRAVLRRLAAEEGAHGAIGWMVLEWAGDRLDAAARRRLARAAEAEIEALFAEWAGLAASPSAASLTAEQKDLWSLVGFAPPATFLDQARRALRQRVAAPLARAGLSIDPAVLDRLAPLA
jgi:hypothetical protein